MNREILFRGKVTDIPLYRQDKTKIGTWVYGSYVSYTVPRIFNLEDEYVVYRRTVGQFTGLYDKNGVTKIFEGDVMQLCSATYPCTVYWDGIGWAWKMNGKLRDIDLTREKMAVIGNIHDNPELVKEGQE